MTVGPEDYPFNQDAPAATKQVWADNQNRKAERTSLGFDKAPRDGKKKIPELPPRGSEPQVLRAWLTYVLKPPENWLYLSFQRFGASRTAPCEIAFLDAESERRPFRLEQFRYLIGTSIGAEIASTTQGICTPPPMTAPEANDVLVALLWTMKQEIKSNEDDNTHDWVDQFRDFARIIEGHTLQPEGRVQALEALKNEPIFGKIEARTPDDGDFTRPILPIIITDHTTGESWCRVSEFGVFIREIMGIGPISWADITARIVSISGEQRRFDIKLPEGGRFKGNLYRLPD